MLVCSVPQKKNKATAEFPLLVSLGVAEGTTAACNSRMKRPQLFLVFLSGKRCVNWWVGAPFF